TGNPTRGRVGVQPARWCPGPRRRRRVLGARVQDHAPDRSAAGRGACAAMSALLASPLVGAGLGLMLGLGLWLTFVRLPVMRRPTLDDRLAPYVRDAVPASRLLGESGRSRGPFGVLERLLAPVMSDAAHWVE